MEDLSMEDLAVEDICGLALDNRRKVRDISCSINLPATFNRLPKGLLRQWTICSMGRGI
jgi:hypothetical protein